MKIAFIEYEFQGGGTTRFSQHFIKACKATGNNIDFIGFSKSGKLLKEMRDEKNLGLKPDHVLSLKQIRDSSNKLKEYDVILLNRAGHRPSDKEKNFDYIEILRRSKTPILLYCHSDFKKEKRWHPYHQQILVLENFKGCVFNSLKEMEGFKLIYPNLKTFLLPLPYESVAKHKNKTEGLKIGTTSRVIATKGIPYIFDEILRSGALNTPGNEFILNGWDNCVRGVWYRDQLREKYPQLFKNSNFIDKGGFYDDNELTERLNELDIHVNFHKREGGGGHFEYTTLEAMAQGCFCVTDEKYYDDFTYQVGDHLDVAFSELGKENSLVEAIKWLKPRIEKKKMSLSNIKYVKDVHSYKVVMNQFNLIMRHINEL